MVEKKPAVVLESEVIVGVDKECKTCSLSAYCMSWGGPSVFAEPNEIADRYHKALQLYLDEIRQLVLESAIDYHRVGIDEDYEKVLMRFLVGRTRARGVR